MLRLAARRPEGGDGGVDGRSADLRLCHLELESQMPVALLLRLRRARLQSNKLL